MVRMPPSLGRLVLLFVAASALLLTCGCTLGVVAGILVAFIDPGDDDAPATGENRPPTVLVEPVTRTVGEVEMNLTVLDPESDPVTLSVEYDTGEGFQSATVEPSEVSSSPTGETVSVNWLAQSDLGSTAFHPDVQLRITPYDGTNQGGAVLTNTFAYGNDAPVLESVSVDIDPVTEVVQGNAIVRFEVSDSSADPVNIVKFEFSETGKFTDADTFSVGLTTGSEGNIPSGALTNLVTSPEGEEHSFVWNSFLTAQVNAFDARIRLTVEDSFADESVPQASATFPLANGVQISPPEAEILNVTPSDSDDVRAGLIAFDYRLVEAQGAICDVIVEYSTDNKATWEPATEYPTARSEGRYDLVATPGGVIHCYVWDAAGDIAQFESLVIVRIIPASENGVGEAAETPITMEVGIPPSEGRFATRTEVTATNTPVYASTADLNSNGKLDLIVLNEGSDTLEVRLGNGDGSFQSASSYTTRTGPRAVAVGDLDGNGHLDVVVASGGANMVSVFPGNGDGTFGTRNDISLGQAPLALVLADFNNNGLLDLAVTTSGGGGPGSRDIRVLLGNGDGTFQSPVNYRVGRESRSLVTGDFTGNGELDLIAASYEDDEIVLWEGQGDGTFDDEVEFGVLNDPLDMAVGDFNGSGHLDLAVVGNSNEDEVFVMLGDGNWTNVDEYPTGGLAPASIATADVTGNGHLDLVVVNAIGDNLAVLKGNGDGTFAAPETFDTTTGPAHVHLTDLTGNRALDAVVAIAGTGQDRVDVFLGRRMDNESWSLALDEFDPGTGSGNAVGASTLASGEDAHEKAYENHIGLHRFRGRHGGAGPDDSRRGAMDDSHEFAQLVRTAGLSPAPPSRLEPVTDAWTVSGFRRLARVPDPGEAVDTGYRLRPTNRFGERLDPGSDRNISRTGLNLSPSQFSEQRGIIVDLPIVSGHDTGELQDAFNADRLHLYLRHTDWVRAEEIPLDPLRGEVIDEVYLPRIDENGDFRNVYQERYTWQRLTPSPANDLTQGNDPRFVLDDLGGAEPRVRVLLEREGTLQLFYEED